MHFLDPQKSQKKLTTADCQWQSRLGDYMKKGEDIWWTINANTNLESLNQEINDLLVNHAVPAIDKLSSDDQLLNLWRSKLPDSLDFRQKLYLAILLKKSGKIDELMLILQQLEEETEGTLTKQYFNIVKKDLLKNA